MIKFDISQGEKLSKKLSNLRASAAFLTSRGLNDTAFEVKSGLEKHVSRRLKIKHRTFKKFKIQKSHKKNLTTTITHIAGNELAKHEYGQTVLPKRRAIAVPTGKVARMASWRTRKKILEKAFTAIRKKNNKPPVPFVLLSKKKNLSGIFIRKTRKRLPIEPIFILSRKNKYRKVLQLKKTVEGIVKGNIEKKINRRIIMFLNKNAT